MAREPRGHRCHSRPLGAAQVKRLGWEGMRGSRCYCGTLKLARDPDLKAPVKREPLRRTPFPGLSAPALAETGLIASALLVLSLLLRPARLSRYADRRRWPDRPGHLPPIAGGAGPYFWVGGTGTWDNSATTHWSASSGGASGAGPPTSADNVTFDSASGLGATTVTIAGTAACNNCTITGPANKSCVFSLSGNFTVSGALSLSGNSATNRLFFRSSTVGTARTFTIATLTALTNADFMDITAAGLATNAAWSGTSLGNALGNSNITFDASVTQTWSANTTGNWSAAANWTSRVPLPQDDVVISGLTSGTVTADMPRLGRSITLAGSSGGTVAVSVTASAYGNWTFVSGVTLTFTGSMTLGGRGSQTITSAGAAFTRTLLIAAPTGTYTLQDDLSVATIANNTLQFQEGTFAANGHNVSAMAVSAQATSDTKAVQFGSGTWTITGNDTNQNPVFAFNAAGLTVTAGTSTIVLSDTTSNAKTFSTGGKTYGNLSITGGGTGTVTLAQAGTFATLTIGAPKTVIFPASTTTTISGLSATGSAGNVITVQSSSPGTKWTLSCTALVDCDYLSVTDSTASGGTFCAGVNGSVTTSIKWVAATRQLLTPSVSAIAAATASAHAPAKLAPTAAAKAAASAIATTTAPLAPAACTAAAGSVPVSAKTYVLAVVQAKASAQAPASARALLTATAAGKAATSNGLIAASRITPQGAAHAEATAATLARSLLTPSAGAKAVATASLTARALLTPTAQSKTQATAALNVRTFVMPSAQTRSAGSVPLSARTFIILGASSKSLAAGTAPVVDGGDSTTASAVVYDGEDSVGAFSITLSGGDSTILVGGVLVTAASRISPTGAGKTSVTSSVGTGASISPAASSRASSSDAITAKALLVPAARSAARALALVTHPAFVVVSASTHASTTVVLSTNELLAPAAHAAARATTVTSALALVRPGARATSTATSDLTVVLVLKALGGVTPSETLLCRVDMSETSLWRVTNAELAFEQVNSSETPLWQVRNTEASPQVLATVT